MKGDDKQIGVSSPRLATPIDYNEMQILREDITISRVDRHYRF